MFRVVTIGEATMDIKAYRERETGGPCAPGHVQFAVGGTARNIAENLARLTVESILLTVIGKDSFGNRVIQQSALGGINCTHLMVSDRERTATFLAILDTDRRVREAVTENRILEMLSPEALSENEDLLRLSNLVVADGTCTRETLIRLHEICMGRDIPLVWSAGPASAAEKLRPLLNGAMLVQANAAECEALTGIRPVDRDSLAAGAAALLDLGAQNALVTAGPLGLHLDFDGESHHLPAVNKSVVDPTGAGDAYLAGLLYGLLHDLGTPKMMEIGQFAADLTLDTMENVHPKLSLDYIHNSVT